MDVETALPAKRVSCRALPARRRPRAHGGSRSRPSEGGVRKLPSQSGARPVST
jgi:hypothetical protein